jgi:hypothetical protein
MTVGCKSQNTAVAVDKICASPGFRRSSRLQRFLRFLASAQAATGSGPKEYEIAREVYDKPEDFGPQLDPIVRVEASRLRLRLSEYYRETGRDDHLVLELPKGSYSLQCRAIARQGAATGQTAGTREHYLRGRYLWSRRTAESLKQATPLTRIVLTQRLGPV